MWFQTSGGFLVMILTTKLYFQTLSIMQQDIFDHFLSSQSNWATKEGKKISFSGLELLVSNPKVAIFAI